MAVYKTVICPTCKKELGCYRVDCSVQKTHGNCKCGSYTVIHGNNEIKLAKGYAK